MSGGIKNKPGNCILNFPLLFRVLVGGIGSNRSRRGDDNGWIELGNISHFVPRTNVLEMCLFP